MRFTPNTTLCRVRFHTFDFGEIDVVTDSGFGPLAAYQTGKRLGPPSGAFTLALKPRVVGGRHDGKAWSDVVQNGDWVSIRALKNGQESRAMLGRVDTVTVGAAAGPLGAAAATTTIQGRDAGYALEDTPLYYNPFDSLYSDSLSTARDNAPGTTYFQLLESMRGVTGDQVIAGMIRGLMGQNGVYGGHVQVPDGVASRPGAYWIDLLNLAPAGQGGALQSLRGEVNSLSLMTSGLAGASSAWAFLEAWRNPLLNEMWLDTGIDVGDPAVYLHLRERPFENMADGQQSPWFALTSWDVDCASLVDFSLARGSNRVNHILLFGELDALAPQAQYSLYRPAMNLTSIKRWGLRRLEERTNYVGPNADQDFQTEHRKWLSLLVGWNALNADHWSGTLSLGEMRPEIRVGQKIHLLGGPPGQCPGLPADGKVANNALSFYVEGVTHDWRDGPTPVARTTLSVTRGFVEGERLSALADAYNDFDLNPAVLAGSINERALDAYGAGDLDALRRDTAVV